jgi:hypothetical protein
MLRNLTFDAEGNFEYDQVFKRSGLLSLSQPRRTVFCLIAQRSFVLYVT